ncbi:MAG: PspC domain-containing protein [Chloroflexota bacterium]|nr:PspC domain-containing protein [Chloroflexota bacterium]
MQTQTRLTRSANDKVLGGVCGGLGHYFGIDPVIVRLIFVGLLFAGGMTVVLYPILWLVMPEAETGQVGITSGLQEMQQVAQQVRAQAGEGVQELRLRMGAAFTSGNPQPRFDPQTGQPLPHVAGQNRNGILGVVLLGLGVMMLASLFPGGSSAAIALLLLAGGFYLLRRGH